MSTNLDKLSLSELTKLKSRVDAAIPKAEAREKAEARAEILALAEKRGFTIADIIGSKPVKAKQTGKVPPKWIDSQTGVKWTGRGRTPRNFDKARSQPIA
jgi:DNA-binding protein H-NS